MLDVGTHCQLCRHIDFLPFHCSLCNSNFCSSHRSKESHYCALLVDDLKKEEVIHVNPPNPRRKNNQTYFQSLLPEKASIRVKNGNKNNNNKNNNSMILSNSIKIEELTFNKITQFFQKNNVQTIKKVVPESSAIINIPGTNKVQVTCYLLQKSPVGDGSSKILTTYINKIWPVVRALNHLSKEFQIPNFRNAPNIQLYKHRKLDKKQSGLQLIDLSDRVSSAIVDSDLLYLIVDN